MNYIILFSALLPAAILIFYIYCKDHKKPEPPKQLYKAFCWGIASASLSTLISLPLIYLGILSDIPSNLTGVLTISFLGAAIPEECSKLIVLWLFQRNNKHFDENMDGIVYAVCVSLGFAALENVLYLFGNRDNWVSIGIARALFSVPGHMFFGILMGYYFSLVKFSPNSSVKNRILVIAAPVITHGLFNSLLFSVQITPKAIQGILMVSFLAFTTSMWSYGSRRIKELLKKDETL